MDSFLVVSNKGRIKNIQQDTRCTYKGKKDEWVSYETVVAVIVLCGVYSYHSNQEIFRKCQQNLFSYYNRMELRLFLFILRSVLCMHSVIYCIVISLHFSAQNKRSVHRKVFKEITLLHKWGVLCETRCSSSPSTARCYQCFAVFHRQVDIKKVKCVI